MKVVQKVDNRTSTERIEDLAFENRIKKLTKDRDWQKLQLTFVDYGLALEERIG